MNAAQIYAEQTIAVANAYAFTRQMIDLALYRRFTEVRRRVRVPLRRDRQDWRAERDHWRLYWLPPMPLYPV
jgi:hypothetical protein